MKKNKLFGKLLTLIILSLMMLSTIVMAEEYAISTNELGVVTLDVHEPSFFEKLFGGAEPFAVITRGEDGKEKSVFSPGEKVSVSLGIEIPTNRESIKEVYFRANKGLSTTPIFYQDLTKDKTIQNLLKYGGGSDVSIQIETSFTAPNNEGSYRLFYAVRNTAEAIITKEEKTITVAKQVTSCPDDQCSEWKWLYTAAGGEGNVYSRTCYKYGDAPACSEKRRDEYKTECFSGALILGSNDKTANRIASCVAAEPESTCEPFEETCNQKDDDCDGQVDEGLTCTFQCSNQGAEVCDGLDNDCDRQVDEGGVCTPETAGETTTPSGSGDSSGSNSSFPFKSTMLIVGVIMMVLGGIGFLIGLIPPIFSIPLLGVGIALILGGRFL